MNQSFIIADATGHFDYLGTAAALQIPNQNKKASIIKPAHSIALSVLGAPLDFVEPEEEVPEELVLFAAAVAVPYTRTYFISKYALAYPELPALITLSLY